MRDRLRILGLLAKVTDKLKRIEQIQHLFPFMNIDTKKHEAVTFGWAI